MLRKNNGASAMEKIFCIMTEAPSGGPVAINPRQVRYVRPTGEPQMCGIYFDNNDSIMVAGTFVQITEQLRSTIT
jgi:hypothetical protein